MRSSTQEQIGYWRRELAAAESTCEAAQRRVTRARENLARAQDAHSRSVSSSSSVRSGSGEDGIADYQLVGITL